MLIEIWNELSRYSAPEIVAVVASLSYILLAANNRRLCWIAAFVGSALYVAIFWQYRLLMDSALNAYYVVMAVVGWFSWSSRDDKLQRSISQWPIHYHCLALLSIAVVSLLSGMWLSKYSNAAFPYLDSLTTWSSLFATWLVVTKVLENWLYWIAIDALSIYLYIEKALFFTTALFALYIVIACYGYWQWRRCLQLQRAEQSRDA